MKHKAVGHAVMVFATPYRRLLSMAATIPAHAVNPRSFLQAKRDGRGPEAPNRHRPGTGNEIDAGYKRATIPNVARQVP